MQVILFILDYIDNQHKIKMKKIFLTSLALLFLFNCEQPYASLTTNDEKTEIIKTLFEEVSEENIEYLKEVFSDSMLFVNPVGGQLNKEGFIAGVEGLYDMFDDISIEEMNGDAIGSEVETVTYKNGIVWTNIWNKFSAKGKYTGQQVSFPFHLSYQWEGDKIIKEVQFFDMSVIEKEMNAKQAALNISKKVVVNIDLSVNKGFSKSDVKSFVKKLNDFIRSNEPNTYDYSYFISDDGKRVTLIEKFRSSKDLIFHADKFESGPNIDTFMKMFSFNSFVVAGNTTEELRERIKSYPVEYRSNIGGWIY